MYVWGSSSFQQPSAFAEPRELLAFPVRAPLRSAAGEIEFDASFKKGVQSLSSGHNHHLLVSDGVVYGLGSNHSNQLGTGLPSYTTSLRVISLKLRSTPVEVACGRRHSLLRCEDGSVYSAGENTCGQLGRESKNFLDFGVLAVSSIVQIAASENSSFALSDKGALYSWGYVGSGHLGHGDKGVNEAAMTSKELRTLSNVERPKQVRWFADKRVRIVQIACGKEHVVVRSDSDVYTLGEGSYGKLGSGDVACLVVPHRVVFPQRKTPEKLIDISAGTSHTLVLKHSGEIGSVVYHFGKSTGDHGTLTPAIVENHYNNIVRVFAGNNCAMGAITQDGKLVVWGDYAPAHSGVPRNADPNKQYPTKVQALDDFTVTHFSCNSTTLIAIADDGRCHRSAHPKKPTVVVIDEEEENGVCNVDNEEQEVDKDVEVIAVTPAAPIVLTPATYHARFDTIIPYVERSNRMAIDRHDENSQLFYRKWLGDVDGAAYVSGLIEAPHPAVVAARKVAKKGAHNLKVGDKVRLWMSDVYALAVVAIPPASMQLGAGSSTPVLGSQKSATDLSTPNRTLSLPSATVPSPHSATTVAHDEAGKQPRVVYLEWMRDDWVPEEVELYSDDETMDNTNENRWQSLWFTESPVSGL